MASAEIWCGYPDVPAHCWSPAAYSRVRSKTGRPAQKLAGTAAVRLFVSSNRLRRRLPTHLAQEPAHFTRAQALEQFPFLIGKRLRKGPGQFLGRTSGRVSLAHVPPQTATCGGADACGAGAGMFRLRQRSCRHRRRRRMHRPSQRKTRRARAPRRFRSFVPDNLQPVRLTSLQPGCSADRRQG